ncbi:ATP-binding protein [Candidatus Woesearchaeota archaeon]|nr:ATP-binding protein [Candidatus Woesearchaeota archaeon]
MGYTELKDELKEILQREEGSTVLLYGPKGTGKSTIPKALAKTLGYSCMEKSAAALQNKFVGEGIKNLDELIDIGKIMAPAVIILDEVTGILEHAGLFSHKSDETSHFNSLFSTGPIKGIYFFGTTNNPTVINTTSLSRFEHKFFVDLPDAEERKGIFRHYIGWEIENIPEGVSCRDIQRAASLLKRKNEREYSHLFFQYLTPENKGQNWEKVREAIGDDLSLIKDYFGVKKDTVELLTSVEVYDKNKTTPREKKNG